MTTENWREEFKEIIKKNLWGLCCASCGGGGMFYDTKCSLCEGTGITDWKIEPLMSKVDSLLSKERNKVIEEMKDNLLKGMGEYDARGGLKIVTKDDMRDLIKDYE